MIGPPVHALRSFLTPRTTRRNKTKKHEKSSNETPDTVEVESPMEDSHHSCDNNNNEQEAAAVPKMAEGDAVAAVSDETLAVAEIYKLIDSEVRVNIGASVKCGICLETMKTPTRTLCGHGFCKACIHTWLQYNSSHCPECHQSGVTKRSLQPHDHLQGLAKMFKQALTEFALIPSQYTSSFTTLTQKQSDTEEDDDDEELEESLDQHVDSHHDTLPGIGKAAQRHLDRLHVAMTWKKRAIPHMQISDTQKEENRQIVEANFQACENAGLIISTDATGGEIPQMDSASNVTTTAANNNRTNKANVPPTPTMPSTQEMQDEARAQQAADFEIRDSQSFLSGTQNSKNLSEVPTPRKVKFIGQQSQPSMSTPSDMCGRRALQSHSNNMDHALPPKPLRKIPNKDMTLTGDVAASSKKQSTPTSRLDNAIPSARTAQASFSASPLVPASTIDVPRQSPPFSDSLSLSPIHHQASQEMPKVIPSPCEETTAAPAANSTMVDDCGPRSPAAHVPTQPEHQASARENSTLQASTTPSVALASTRPIQTATKRSQRCTQDSKANITGLLEDSFGALHWTNKDISLTLSDDNNDQSEDDDDDKRSTPIKPIPTPKDDSSLVQHPATTAVSNDVKESAKETRKDLGDPVMDSNDLDDDTVPMSTTDNGEDYLLGGSLETETKEDVNSTNPTRSTRSKKTRTTPLRLNQESERDEDDNSAIDVVSATQNRQTRSATKSGSSSEEPSEHGYFEIGDIVNVQPRTWSGINKLGGVARVTRVNPDSTYNVSYVLGGKESNVDSVFLSCTGERGKRRRCETIEAALPTSLLQELVKQGFDTSVSLSQAQAAAVKRTSGTDDRGKANPSKRKRILSEVPNHKSRDNQKKSRHTISCIPQTAKRARSHSSASISSEAGLNRLLRRRNAKSIREGISEEETVHGKNEEDEVMDTISQNPATIESCKLSGERYTTLLEEACSGKVIHAVASNLSEQDMDVLRALCAKTLEHGVKVKLSENFGKNTRLCVTPIKSVSTGDSTTLFRTAKIMRSSLAGIPIVSPEWVQNCLEQNRPSISPSLVARSIPTKVDRSLSKEDARFGVAKLAANHQRDIPLPLHNYFVFLCGTFAENKRRDLQLLAREAGAKVLTSISAVSSKLGNSKVVLLCQDTTSGNVIPVSIMKEAQSCLKKDASTVLVVNPQWIFESITCAKAVSTGAFPPSNSNALKLFKLSQAT